MPVPFVLPPRRKEFWRLKHLNPTNAEMVTGLERVVPEKNLQSEEALERFRNFGGKNACFT